MYLGGGEGRGERAYGFWGGGEGFDGFDAGDAGGDEVV